MDYTQISLTLKPYTTENAEILMAWMETIGYESFMENETGFDAYIPSEAFNEEALKNLKEDAGAIKFEYTIVTIPHQNWNAVWESNYFKPIIIGNECVVRSPFHEHFPHIRHQIVIEPKMAFGTGHHETTAMVMEHILAINFTGKKVLDMGCGTGILGILASMRGALEVVGIDIDHWCTENSEENCRLNKIYNMKVLLGDASTLLTLSTFDIILANINRNILVEDIPAYGKLLQKGGILVLSGFYNSDLDAIDQIAQKQNLLIKSVKENNNWVAVSYEKQI
jgi:ribosomal protein L11 methyltransferase